MLGLIFIIVTYAVVVGVCFLVKYVKGKINALKNSQNQTSSKIYYVTNSPTKKRSVARKKPDIAIKGSIIEKIENE